MQKRRLVLSTAALAALLVIVSTSAAEARFPNILAQAVGGDSASPGMVPAPDGSGSIPAACLDGQLVSPVWERQIGTVTICLSNPQIVYQTPFGNGVSNLVTTFLHFPFGTLVVQNRGTVAPRTSAESMPERTHATGAIPAAGVKNILAEEGTGLFRGTEGSVRQSGAIHLTPPIDLSDPTNPAGPLTIDFDLLYVIDLDL